MKFLAAMSRSALMGMALVLSTASSSLAASLTLTGTIRDFRESHPDFEYRITGLEEGIVKNTLGVDGKPVYSEKPTLKSTTNKSNFDQWYRDVAGVNTSKQHAITLQDPEKDGIFTYASSSFFPIDGQLFGNERFNHNYHFTYEINSKFTYRGGEIFKFTGDDDVFAFINGKLAIDLGGVHDSLSREVKLDNIAASFGLVKGNDYSLDLFFAERHTVKSNFKIETSLLLRQSSKPVPEPASMSLFSLGLLGIGFMQSRKKSV